MIDSLHDEDVMTPGDAITRRKRQIRHELLDEEFRRELESIYRGAGADVLAYAGASDAEAVG